MGREYSAAPLNRKIIDALYVEAMVLADEARAYFDRERDSPQMQQNPLLRITLSCEAIKVTTRLMNIISWLVARRAIDRGEYHSTRSMRMAAPPAGPGPGFATLPDEARAIIEASIDLHARISRIDHDQNEPHSSASPARTLIAQLEGAF